MGSGKQYQYTCIVCPLSCRISVVQESSGKLRVSGNECKRGEAHALHEHTDPHRILTTTVKVEQGGLSRLPVISDGEIPKKRIKEGLALLYTMSVEAPVKCGDIIVEDLLGLGVNMVASRSIGRADKSAEQARPGTGKNTALNKRNQGKV